MRCLVCGSTTTPFYKDLYDDRYGALGYFSVYRCTRCGFGRTDPILSRKEIGNFYGKYYPLGRTTIKDVKKSVTVANSLLAWMSGIDATAHRKIKKGSDVLDIGSGSGVSLLEIKKTGSNAWGVEPDHNAQRIAKKLKLKVYEGFLTDNPFPGRQFDYITASQVLEHEPDPLKFLLSAKKKIKTAGKIILTFPNMDSVYRKIFGKKWLNWHIPYHINFFTKESLNRLSKKSGLKIITYRTVTPNIWTVFQLRSLLVKTKMGSKNPLWSGQSGMATKVINIFLFFIALPVNRLIDVFGLGDSILVTLEK